MIALPVHCCCDPQRRLGWVQLPASMAKRGLNIRLQAGSAPGPGVTGYVPRWILTTIEELQVCLCPIVPLPCGHPSVPLYMRRSAVKSADVPLEAWEKVLGFTRLPPWKAIVDNNRMTV